MTDLTQELARIEQQRQELQVAEFMAIEKGLNSSSPATAVAATRALNKRLHDVEVREQTDQKSYLLDPNVLLDTGSGYRERQSSSLQMGYELLRKMGRTPIIRSVIDTRIEQVAAFATPQSTRYANGFIIRKKRPWGTDKEPTLSRFDQRKIEIYTEMLLNGGTQANRWHGDTFETALRKGTRDSLEIDQDVMEVVRTRRGLPCEFVVPDAATFRWASSAGFEGQEQSERQRGVWRLDAHSRLPAVNGYRPTVVQVLDGQIHSEYYPWELAMGIRNIRSDASLGGYGISELEDLVTTVTALLDSDAYNRNFFKIGSAPKGFLKVKGTVSREKLNEFRTDWRMMMAGVQNAHRTAVLPQDVDWVSLMQTNRDMEYSHFNEYLIKLVCSLYKIDPKEIGFDLGGTDGQKPLFEGNNEARLKYSRDKGLYPLLKFKAAYLNKYWMNPLDDEFELLFVGLDSLTEADELDQDIKKLGAYMTFNEIRKRRGLEEVEGGDVIAHALYLQNLQQQQQQEQQEASGGQPGAPGADPSQLTDPNATGGTDDNPFLKSFHANLAIYE